MRRCKNKHTWYALHLCNTEVRKQGRAQFKRTKTVCFHSGKLFLLSGILEDVVCPGEKKKKKKSQLLWIVGSTAWAYSGDSKTLTQLSWLVKLHCGVFRKDAASPGFEEELVGWAVVPNPDWFLVLQSASNSSLKTNTAGTLSGSAKASMCAWRLALGQMFALL